MFSLCEKIENVNLLMQSNTKIMNDFNFNMLFCDKQKLTSLFAKITINIINTLGIINPFYNTLTKIKTSYNLLKYIYDRNDYTRCGITHQNVTQILNFESSVAKGKKLLNIKEIIDVIDSNCVGYFTIELNNNHLPNQHINGHILVIEKTHDNKFIIYQSFLYNYDILENMHNSKYIYSKENIINYFENVLSLFDKGEWNDTTKENFKKCFNVNTDVVGSKTENDEWKGYIMFTEYLRPKKYLMSTFLYYHILNIIFICCI